MYAAWSNLISNLTITKEKGETMSNLLATFSLLIISSFLDNILASCADDMHAFYDWLRAWDHLRKK